MNIQSIRPEQLTDEMIDSWLESCRRSPHLYGSPFLSPYFTLAAAPYRPRVEVGIIGDVAADPSGVAFFPFERQRERIAVPVGDPLNDFHGIVAPPHFSLDSRQLLQGLQLSEWRFHHQLADHPTFAAALYERRPSPYVDLTQGFARYYAGRRQAHPRTFKDQQKRWRGLAEFTASRGWGPLRFEFDVREPAILDQLIAWKRNQYARTRRTDVFAHDWTRQLVHELARSSMPNFGGVHSVLFAGERPIAAHFGLRFNHTLHCWFPAFDLECAKWSPGLQLWVRFMEASPQHGIHRIDFGSGPETFKYKLSNAQSWVGVGSANTSGWRDLC
ncbi:MAG: GNAT family N-acetyltransferase, partial [Planctomycetota bacterium]